MVNTRSATAPPPSRVASPTNEKEENEMDSSGPSNIHTPNEDVVMTDENAKQTAEWEAEIARLEKQRTTALLRSRFEQLREEAKTGFVIPILPSRSVGDNLSAEDARIQALCKEEERLKVPAIPKYEGKTQAEYREFIRSCVKTFDMKRTIYRDELRQIQCAVAHLGRDSDAAWFRLEETNKPITWQKFSEWLLDELMPRDQRKFYMYRKYKNARQLKDQTVGEYITYFKNIESDIVMFSEEQRIHFLLHGLNQEIYTQLMYDTIPTNFSALCDKATQIESVKKKTANQGDKPEGGPRRTQSFSGQHRTSPYGRDGSRGRGRSQSGSERGDRRGGRGGGYRARGRSTGSPATGPNTVRGGRQQGAPREEVKCYNCQKLGHYANDCPEPDHKQQGNVRGQ